MKNLKYLPLVFFYILLTGQIYSQETWQCGVTDAVDPTLSQFIGSAQHNVLIVYIDFPDGRVQPGNVIPTDDQMLSSVQNIDAVCNLGYDAAPLPLDPYAGWPTHARKYTYFDIWDRFFSDNVYIGSRHPDWESHGKYGLPLASGSTIPNNMIPGDTAKGYGSVRDYFKEVSYNNLLLEPYNIRPNYNEDPDPRYKKGIINNVSAPDIWGNRFLIPVMMPLNKTQYDFNNDLVMTPFVNTVVPAAVLLATGFDINAFCQNSNNKVIIIYSGFNAPVGGAAYPSANRCILREKLTPNTEVYGNQRSVLDGIAPTCHEYGHLLGWSHSTLGNYCIMNTGTDNQNCPPHPNMVYKLRAGWVNNVTKINTNQSVGALAPSILNQGECAVVTIYGKAGYGDNYEHSEYYVIENRRMIRDNPDIKFDKKLVWRRDLDPATPNGFTGGILIYHCNGRYNDFNFPCNDCGWDKSVKGVFPRLSDEPFGGDGDSKHFFGVPTSIGPPVSNIFQDRTNSSFNLPTGIQITGITQNGNNFSFNVGYNSGAPPNYNTVIYEQGNYSNPLSLTGNVFFHKKPASLTHLYIEAGSIVEFPKPLVFDFKGIKAAGLQNNPILFTSCGYGSNRTQMGNVKVSSPSALGIVNETIFRYCQFQNVSPENSVLYVISINNINEQNPAPIILESNILPQGKKILITSTPTTRNLISSINNNSADILIANSQSNPAMVTGEIQIPISYNLTLNAGSSFEFSDAGIINCNGTLIAEGNINSRIIFSKSILSSSWSGINIIGGMASIKYCNVSNSADGISMSSPGNGMVIDNCNFTGNLNRDLSLNSFYADNDINFSNNNFSGSRNECNLKLNNGNSVTIYNNTFTGINIKGISSNFAVAPYIDHNSISGIVGGGGSIGIYSYNSGGTFTCNTLQNLSNGILLDNSSPIVYNNTVNSNVVGMYLTNGSTPVMSPSSDLTHTLINAGYNTFTNSLNEEIYCNNSSFLPLSLPLMQNGYNSIFDFNFAGCLINTNNPTPNILAAQNNYWGNPPQHPVASDFCPEGSVDYSFPLTGIPNPPENCNSTTIAGNNSSLPPDVLVLGSANIDFNASNYNSASLKYKNYINSVNDINKLILPMNLLFYSTIKGNGNLIELENYYSGLSQQYSNDSILSHTAANLSTKSEVEQTSYTEAITDYNSVISNSQNPAEVFYAYIDKMRVLSLMLDTIFGGGGGNGPQGGSQSSNINDIENTLKEFINLKVEKSCGINDITITKSRGTMVDDNSSKSGNSSSISKIVDSKTSNIKSSSIKKSLNLDNIDLKNKTNIEIKKIIERSINFKLTEFSLLNYISSEKIPDIPYIKNSNSININLPIRFNIYQNYPNPFNPVSTIKYDIPKQSQVTIKIFDIIGREVSTLVNETKEPGFYTVSFDGTNYSSGVYFYRIEARQAGSSTVTFTNVKKMVLLK